MPSNLTCPSCGQSKRPEYERCWRCFQIAREKTEFDRGYENGFTDGYRKAREHYSGSVVIDKEMWRRLQQLCHPDKHANNLASSNATAWLNSIRPDIEARPQ